MNPRVRTACRRAVLAGVVLACGAAHAALTGFAVGSACFTDPNDYVAAVCAEVAGTLAAGGIQQCTNASSPAPGRVGFTIVYSHPDNTSDYVYGQRFLAPCEPRDWSYFGPLVALFSTTLLVIACSKRMSSLFKRETH